MICSFCNSPMLGEWSRDGQTRVAWLCTACCARVPVSDMPEMAPNRHADATGRPAASNVAQARESDVQRRIVDALERRGYIVQVTSRQRRGVMVDGKWRHSHRGDGVSRGLADLLVRNPTWAPCMWMAIEVKRPSGAASDTQWRLAQDGHIRIVSSVEDALEAVGNA